MSMIPAFFQNRGAIARSIPYLLKETSPLWKALPPETPAPILTSAPQKNPLVSSSWRYLAAAVLTAAAAAAIFSFYPPLGTIFATLAGWTFCICSTKLLSHAFQNSDRFAAKGIRWAKSMMAEITAAVICAFLFPLTLSKEFHKPAGDLKGRPILMISGYLSFGSTWYYQRKLLAERGLGPIYTMNIGSFKSIKSCARHVQAQVKEIQEETGRKDLALICHSKGGLVGSCYATYFAAKDGAKVTDVVTIGSPLSGTPLAKIGFGKDARQMEPDHPFHFDLRKKIEEHPEIRFFNIASETDWAVPLKSALLPSIPSSRQRVFKDIGHLGLIFSERAADQIHSWLKA